MSETSRTLWIGCYTKGSGGDGDGVVAVDLRSGVQTTVTTGLTSPSWLVDHPSGVLAICETDPGHVGRVDPRLTEGGPAAAVATVTTGSGGPCHCSLVSPFVAPSSHLRTAPSLLAVAHYGAGTVSTVALDDDGDPRAVVDVLDLGGHPLGPRTDRQDGSHPHQAVLDDETGVLLVPDLGADLVHRLVVDEDGRLEATTPVRLPAGFGPRHLVVTGDLLLVVGELASELWVGRRTRDGWSGVSTTSTHATPFDPSSSSDPDVGNTPSAIQVDGDDVVVGNRGADTVTVLRLDRSAGTSTQVRELPAQVVWPRDLVLDGDDLWVAGERSHTVVRMTWRGEEAGTVRQTIRTPSPTAVLLR